MPETAKHSMWVGIGKQLLSFGVGVIVAAFILGRNAQKINDVVAWKTEMAPRIERMDRQGSLSFENFHVVYTKEQTQQYERLKKLETEVNHLESMNLKIDRLERKLGDPPRDNP